MNKEESLDPRITRTREQFQRTILELLDEKGFQDLTIQEIADRAGLNRVTFYLHYKDKFDLLSKAMQNIQNELFAELRKHYSKDFSPEKPAGLFERLFEHFEEYDNFYEAMLNKETSSVFFEYFLDLLAAESKRRVSAYQQTHKLAISEQYRNDLSYYYSAGAIIGSLIWWIKNKKPIPSTEVGTLVSKFFMLGAFKSLGFGDFNSPD